MEVLRPLDLCLEWLAGPTVGTLRCVAIPGRIGGLGLSSAGEVLWDSEQSLAAQLCVSVDGRLVLLRLAGSPELVLRRGQRLLQVPALKPVVLVDRDRLESKTWAVRVHVHGEAASIAAPEKLEIPRKRLLLRATAAALTVAAIGSTTQTTQGQDAGSSGQEAGLEAEAGEDQDAQETEEIDVREQPPVAPLPQTEPEPAGMCSTSTPGRRR